MVNLSEFKVEVIYANLQQQALIDVVVVVGTTVLAAIRQSGVLSDFPAIDLTQNKVGIFGKLVSLETILQTDDRIEIYHPLLIDPKTARKKRAKQQK